MIPSFFPYLLRALKRQTLEEIFLEWNSPQSAYTPAMTLNKAAFLALVGMILTTILLVGGFIVDVFNVVRGLIPAMRLLTSFIYAFAGLSMVMFLYAFHKSQS
jgi:uncharacterized membrane protein YuzA (DUF378 family)